MFTESQNLCYLCYLCDYPPLTVPFSPLLSAPRKIRIFSRNNPSLDFVAWLVQVIGLPLYTHYWLYTINYTLYTLKGAIHCFWGTTKKSMSFISISTSKSYGNHTQGYKKGWFVSVNQPSSAILPLLLSPLASVPIGARTDNGTTGTGTTGTGSCFITCDKSCFYWFLSISPTDAMMLFYPSILLIQTSLYLQAIVEKRCYSLRQSFLLSAS